MPRCLECVCFNFIFQLNDQFWNAMHVFEALNKAQDMHKKFIYLSIVTSICLKSLSPVFNINTAV